MEVKLNLQSKPGKECLLEFQVTNSKLVIPEQEQQEIKEIIRRESSEIAQRSGKERFCFALGRRVLELLEDKMTTEIEDKAENVFQFRIHLNEPDISEGMSTSTTIIDAKTLLSQSKILMVEDNPLNVFVGTKFLQKWEIEVHVAENGKIALDMLLNNSYDLILMDLQMPEMDGYETTEKIRQFSDLHKASIPILAISAAVEKHVKDKAFEVGMNDFVFKPFNPEELQAKLAKYLLPRKAS